MPIVTEIFTESIERGIKSCASRAKYGLSPRVLTQLEGGPTMIPHVSFLIYGDGNRAFMYGSHSTYLYRVGKHPIFHVFL